MTWSLASDSPLLELCDQTKRKAQFSIATPEAVELPDEPLLLVGAATVDITPPPGMPKAGYSSNAHTGRGFRTRLRATITHIRHRRAAIAIVQCDLLGGSSIVQHLVARDIARDTDVPITGLWMGATHTHAGPGQFLGTDFYNQFASNRAGFDPQYTQFLASQIADGVRRAVHERREGRVAIGTCDVWGLTRNRSLDPHVQNETVSDKRLDPQRKFVSLNPKLHMVRTDTVEADGSTRPLAAAVIFSIHGTGVSQHADEYHADVWAFLTGECADRVERATGVRPHVGAMEGTHADVAPAIRPGQAGYLEAERIGRLIGGHAAALHDSLGAQLCDTLDVGYGFNEIDLDVDRSIDGITLPDRAAVGAALVAGAFENYTPVIYRIPPFAPGHPRKRATGPHGEKHVIGTRWLQPLVLPKAGFPRVLSVHVLRLGEAMLVGLPFEITTETGRRVAAAVNGAVGGQGIDRVVVCSVVNEYSGYVTTPEEYRRQFYEGGHTIYGPNTQPFLTAHAAKLAGSVVRDKAVHGALPARHYKLHLGHYFARVPGAQGSAGAGAVVADDAHARTAPSAAHFVDPDAKHDGYWETTWTDVAPGALAWHEPMVRVEAATDGGAWTTAIADGRAVDDQSWMIEVRHLPPHPGDARHHYVARWWNPSFAADRRHRFVLCANAGLPECIGEPFD